MFKLQQTWHALLDRNPGLKTLLQYHPVALLLSLTAHLLLLSSSVNLNVTLTGDTGRNKQQNVSKNFNIHLVQPGASNSKPEAPPSSNPEPTTALRPQPPLTDNTSPALQTPASKLPLLDIFEQPEPYYYKPAELQIKPRVVIDTTQNLKLSSNSDPSRSAKLRLLINEYGDIDHIIIDKTSFSEHAQQLLLKTFSRMKFKPGMINNMPVKSELIIEVEEEKTEVFNLPW